MWMMAGVPYVERQVAEGWAEPPKNLGEVIADELVRICHAREMEEPIMLDGEERSRMVRVVREWEAVGE